jgi:hypothetical protein
MPHLHPETEHLTQNCRDCHYVCYEMTVNPCPRMGGKHTESKHF